MSVKNVNFGTNRPDQLHHVPVDRTDQAGAASSTPKVEDKTTPAQDRVEISEAARAAAEAKAALEQELAFARRAMEGVPPLSAERVEEIAKRVEEDFYGRSEVVKQLSHQITQEISGMKDPGASSRDV